MRGALLLWLGSLLWPTLVASQTAIEPDVIEVELPVPGQPPKQRYTPTPEQQKEYERWSRFSDNFEKMAKKQGFRGAIGTDYGVVRVIGDTRKHLKLGMDDLWPWASVTKQVVAVIVMQEVAKGKIELDQPVSRYLPTFASPNAAKVTVRQLLQHQSGLPNPDDVQASSIAASAYYMPFYRGSRDPLKGYCAGKPKGEPGGNWSYNNCDYLVVGELLKAVTGKSWQDLVDDRIAKPLGLTSLRAFPTDQKVQKGFENGRPAPKFDISTFGAAGALYGTVNDLIRFDKALMAGRLLPKAQMDILWDGKPELGFLALGQWVFEAQPKGCEKAVKIVERRGAIGGIQVRNLILPAQGITIVAFTNQGEFDFGEIWQGKGLNHDMIAEAVCT